MFEIGKHPDDYYLGIWYAHDSVGNDILMNVYKREGKWVMEYRFRYKKDDRIFDSNDEKSFYKGTLQKDMSEEEIEKDMNMIFDVISKTRYPHVSYVPVKGDVEKYIFELSMQPWAHVKMCDTKTQEGRDQLGKYGMKFDKEGKVIEDEKDNKPKTSKRTKQDVSA